MANSNETTTKLGVDISELKKGLQDASRQMRLANSEFKAAAAGMDDWSKSSEGLEAKITQLGSILDAEKKKLSILEQQYAAVAAEQGANSKAAEELMIKINNQKASIGNTEKQLRTYNTKLDDCRTAAQELAQEQTDTANSFDKLKDKVSDQEQELKNLKDEYANLVIEQGKESEAAKDVAGKISALSDDLNENRSRLDAAAGAADDLTGSFSDTDTAADNASDGFTIMKGALADLAADGIRACIDALKDFVTETETAYDSFQAQTGLASDEMGDFKDVMDDLYRNAYGDSLNDVADAMSKVKQYTGEVDAGKIGDLTENVMTLVDTFDMDFNETLRGIDSLMTNFGLTSDEAFDLMATGAQKGLDKSGELGDNIAEYGQLWSQAGFSAEDMFAILQNGLDNGAYNLDKVNDFVKEFTISLSDGRIEDNLSLFSDETGDLFHKWKKGKATSQDVFNSVVKDLKKTTNKQDALTTASTVWSALGEDNAMKIITSLTDVNTNFDNVKGTMDKVKEVKYDNVSTQLKTLGRTAQQELLVPLAEKIIPKVTDFVNWCVDNFDSLVPILEGVGAALITAFAVQKIGAAVVGINGIVTAVKAWTVATEAQTAAQKLLSIATSATPWGIAATAIGLLVGGVVAWTAATDDQTQSENEAYAAIDALNTKIGENKKAYDDAAQARKDAVADTSAEFSYYQQLKDELDGIIDKNGKVKEGYENRAAFIVSTLSEATGQEIEMNNGVIESYDKISQSIDNLLLKKQAEAQLANYEESYNTAITNRTQAYNDLVTAQENASTVADDLKAAKDKLAEAEDGVAAAAGKSDFAIQNANNTLMNATGEVARMEQKQKEANKAVSDAQTVFTGYQDTIKNYENVSAAIIEGDTDKISTSLNNLINNFVNAENGTKKSLENQVKNMQKNYDNLKKAVDEKAPGVTQEMVDTAKEMVDKSVAELDKFESQAETEGTDGGKAATKGMYSQMQNFEKAAKDVAKKGQDGLSFYDYNATGQKEGADFVSGVSSKSGDATAAGKTLGNNANNGAGSVNPTITGSKFGIWYFDGIASKNGVAKNAGKALGENADDGAQSVSGETAGSYFGEGFTNGIGSWVASAATAAASLASSAIAKIKEITDEHSPSKVTQQVGAYFSEGFAIGISEKAKAAVKAAKSLAIDALEPLNNSSIDIDSGIETASRATSAAASGGSNTTNNSSVTNNFYQTNNSPKPLSRLEVYRQSKNLLSAKGV